MTRRAAIANRARDALAEIFEDVDVLLTFSAPGAAPKGLASTGDPRFNRLWTLMGVPCVNVPAYIADGGLPVGVQVIARFGDDAGALAAARFVEEALRVVRRVGKGASSAVPTIVTTNANGGHAYALRARRTLPTTRYFSPIRPSVPACSRLMFSRCA